jgi:hypothetical protein
MAELPENQQPSVDPSELDSTVGMLRFVLKKFLQGVDDCMPATIIAYDRVANVATVQPMIKILSTENEVLSRAPIAKVPVFSIGGGNFFVSFPLKAGDTGWIKANDRDISLYLQGARAQVAPNTNRLHSFSDGLFFPDIMNDYTIAPEDMDGNMVIQNKLGTVKIALWPDKIKMLAPDIESIGSWLHTGTMDIVGDTTITGATDITGDVATIGQLHNNGVNVGSTHIHTGSPTAPLGAVSDPGMPV